MEELESNLNELNKLIEDSRKNKAIDIIECVSILLPPNPAKDLLNKCLSELMKKKQEKFNKMVITTLENITKEVSLKIDEGDLYIMMGLQPLYLMEYQEKKLEYYRNYLKYNISNTNISYDNKKIYLEIISELKMTHFQIMIFIECNISTINWKIIDNKKFRRLDDIYNFYKKENDIIEEDFIFYINDLDKRGLIRLNKDLTGKGDFATDNGSPTITINKHFTEIMTMIKNKS